jgi:RNA polymerase sigma-70 factor, ECF subfamily
MATLSGSQDPVDPTSERDCDESEFEAELGPLLDEALHLAVGMLLNAAEAEDAVQEACVRAWRRRANRWPDTDLRPWFLRIVANQCREARRGRWWPLIRVADIVASAGPRPRDPDATLDLRRAIGELPYRRRLVVVLRYYLDLSFEDVAAAAGCSVDAAKALVRRATSDLARSLTIPEETE